MRSKDVAPRRGSDPRMKRGGVRRSAPRGMTANGKVAIRVAARVAALTPMDSGSGSESSGSPGRTSPTLGGASTNSLIQLRVCAPTAMLILERQMGGSTSRKRLRS
jgi:hypothetical protein